MKIKTTAKVTPDRMLIVEEKHQKFLKPGLKLNIVIEDEEFKSDRKESLEFILKTAKESSIGLKSDAINREWIYTRD